MSNRIDREQEMDYRTTIFVDFWNFSLQWRNRASGDRIDWTRVPPALLAESERQLQSAITGDTLHLEETLVFASYDEDDAGRKLKGWLDAFLDKQPRFQVNTRIRRSKARSVYCRACEKSIERCPHCEELLRWAPEKGVDTSIVTGMLSLASEKAYDAALLVSSDTDYLPAVEYLQSRGFKVINATWANHGHELARACWASFELDAIVPELRQLIVPGTVESTPIAVPPTPLQNAPEAPDGGLPVVIGGAPNGQASVPAGAAPAAAPAPAAPAPVAPAPVAPAPMPAAVAPAAAPAPVAPAPVPAAVAPAAVPASVPAAAPTAAPAEVAPTPALAEGHPDSVQGNGVQADAPAEGTPAAPVPTAG
jgi:NYN domain